MSGTQRFRDSRRIGTRLVGMTLAGAMLASLLSAGSARAQDVIDLAQSPFNARAAVPPLLLLAIDPGLELLSSAWPETYDPARPHRGYFNHRKCYRHDAGNDLFTIDSDADDRHSCSRSRSTYSGNFLNWASMTMLDMLRYALTGGRRVVDTPGQTVLERADAGEPGSRLDGGSDSLRKSADGDDVDIRRLTPFNVPTIHALSCGTRLLLADSPFVDGCSGRIRNGRRLLAELELRVRVCDGADDRHHYCMQDRFSKPHGELQRVAHWLRIGLLTRSTGSVPQASARFIGPFGDLADPPGKPNVQAEWDPDTGVARNGGGAHDGVLKQLNELSPRTKGGNGDVYRKTLAWLEAGGNAGTVRASCQNNTVLHVGALPQPSASKSSTPTVPADWTQRIFELETDAGATRGNPSPRSAELTDPRSDAMQLAALAYRSNIGGGSAVAAGATTIAIEYGSGAGHGDAYPTPSASQRSPLFLLAAKYGGFDDANGDGNPFRTSPPAGVRWDDPGQIEWDRNDDGVADAYHRAADGEQLLRAVRDAFRQIARSRSQELASGDVAVGQVQRGNLYLASYEARSWSGAIRRHGLATTEQAGVARSDEPVWESSIPAPGERNLMTTGRDSTGRMIAIPLEWSRLTAEQQAQLDTSPETGERDRLGVQRIAWLRGDRQTEEGKGGILRRRWAPLGDIVHSNLVFSGDEPAVLFAGANDGLLHAFDTASGRELFAWLPATLLPLLPELTAPIYSHRALLDGGLDVARVDIGGASRSVLAGSFGRGARGLFALDVTNPVAFGKESGPLFEFGVAEDAEIGHVLGAPRVVRIAVESPSKKSAPQSTVLRPFLLAEAGVNAAAGLYLIALDKPANEAWRKGVNWFRIGAVSEHAANARHLATPALVLSDDGSLAHAWAGDGSGNLWRFSFKPDRNAAAGFKVETTLLFQARAADGSAQPITSSPRIAYANGGGYIVLFGTGKLLEHRDAAAGARWSESLYSVHDRLVAGPVVTRASLAAREIDVGDDAGGRVTGNAFSYSDRMRGWVIDLPPGERVIASPALAGARLHAMTLRIPDQPCVPVSHRVRDVDALTGLSETAVLAGNSGHAALRAPLVVGIANSSGRPDAFGRWNGGGLHAILFQDPGTGGSGPASIRADRAPAGRLSWKEIVNWQQIRDDARAK